MDQSAERVAASGAKVGRRCVLREWFEWCCVMQCPIGAMVVEVCHVLRPYRLEVAVVDDQHSVE